MRASKIVSLSLGAMLLAAGGIAACSLGLDESLITGGDGGPEAAASDAGDAGVDASNPVECTSDPDCTPANACLTGHCDTASKKCVYDLCPAAACQASVCDSNSKTCSVPTSYGFHAGSFHVALGDIGCGGGGGGARRCFAAVFPFVFVGTTNGVIAYSVADPTDSNPPSVPVSGLPFFPTYIVQSGARVYFVGSVVGTGPDYNVPIAWLDVPSDPTVKQISATTVFEKISVPAINQVLPDTAGGVYLVRNDNNLSYPAAHITAPLKDLDTISFFATAGIPASSGVALASGSRLVTFHQQNGGNFDTLFSLEPNAATGSAQNSGEQGTLAGMGTTYNPSYLAQTPTGGVLWSTSSVTVPDGGPNTTVSARLAWLLEDEKATVFDATTHVDIETFNQGGLGAQLPGPIAWLDDKRVLVLSASATTPTQTAVQVATRDPSPAIIPNRRFVLAFQPNELAAAASNGYGYVLTPDANAGANVHVFGAGCDN